MRTKIFAAAGLCSAMAVSACTTTDPYTGETVRSNTRTGALIGAAAGAALGYATNTNNSEEGRQNALIGAGVGALAGAGVGVYMDRQQEELRRELAGSGVDVTRQGDDLILNVPGDVTFAVDSANIASQFYPVLDDVAGVLARYPQTTVDVLGHADSTGAESYNQALSERRASSVAGYLTSRGVIRERLYVAGFGETRPIASNETADGRSRNRRVEIVIQPFTGDAVG